MKTRRIMCLLTVLLLLLSAMGPLSAAGEETFLAREEGCKLLTFYWQGDADIATSDMWIWYTGRDGKGYLFTPCEYGFKLQLNVPETETEVGFIVRTKCSQPGGSSWGDATKDFAEDRFAQMTSEDTVIYLKQGDGKQYRSDDGGKTLTEITCFKMAAMASEYDIKYTIAPAARIENLDQIRVYDRNGRRMEIEKLSSLGNKVIMGTVTLKEPMALSETYTLEIEGYGSHSVIPTEIFDSPAFIEKYTYDGDDLGAHIIGDNTVFKLWAPTASRVVLNLFESGNDCEAFANTDMTYTDQGVWETTVPCGHDTYYTYTVTTAAGTQEAVDPYARAVGVNGDRGMVLSPDMTDPEGFDHDTWYAGITDYEQAVIWEAHVRDFSISLNQSQYPGKYLAFTETGLTNAAGQKVGIDYVKDLGITHIHLQPIYDFATNDERRDDNYNWGYDPKNYNAPDGSYSLDPYHGEVRVNELKQLVQAVHANGMGVVMDVVYNHTYDANSSLNKIVPYYYYRYTPTGDNGGGSGCGNETASERKMYRKFMLDSVKYWAEEYHIDGFRFDLMALHDVTTMQEIEKALHVINPNCIIYGEGWTGGTSVLNANFQTTQKNISKITASENAIGGIAVFNDSIRDGLKGSVFNDKETGYISGSATKTNAYKVIFGLTGGVKNLSTSWKANDQGVINYMSCHDNMTLYDKLLISCPDADAEERLSMYRLGAAAVFLSRGTPFMLAGEEMLRTKLGNSNSYNAGDEVNHIDWESLVPGSAPQQMRDYYAALIALRKENSFITEADVTCEILQGNAIGITYSKEDSVIAFAVINPKQGSFTQVLPEGEFTYLAGGEGTVRGAVSVPAVSWMLLKKN